MIEVKLTDFEDFRPKLLINAKKLLKNRGFCERHGELDEFSKDLVQQTYLRFHEYINDKYVDINHFENFLYVVMYREFLQLVDKNRRGAQYLLFKLPESNNWFKNEFKQMDVRRSVKCTSDEFDILESFKKDLNSKECFILNGLIEGYSQQDISKKMDIGFSQVSKLVVKMRKKYREHIK